MFGENCISWYLIGSRASDSKDENEVRVVPDTSQWKRGAKAGNVYDGGQWSYVHPCIERVQRKILLRKHWWVPVTSLHKHEFNSTLEYIFWSSYVVIHFADVLE
jgi:hypothetical protein